MKQKKSSTVFAVAQQIGKSIFLPITILPFAGLMLGIGSSFTNSANAIVNAGSPLYNFMLVLKCAGNSVFQNLALIFALCVALGMAKREKGTAVVSAGVFYIVMLSTINVLLNITGAIVDGTVSSAVKPGSIETVLGIQTLQMGVFGGIVAGIITAVLCNKFYKIKLPDVLSFFSGTRFIPIASMFFAVITGAVLFIVWPAIQNGVYALSGLIQASGYFGTFAYGCIERMLIPFGLHHIFYIPFWQTGLGGTAVINGTSVMGAQNIFFAELASPDISHFSVNACRFLTGKYPYMMGGLPGAALAMYTCARPEKKKAAGAILLSAALTSFLTGATEPIEFTFLFVAPALFVIHSLLAGVSFAICHILNICVGATFSDGLIDLILYGVLPGNAKSNWVMLIPVIIIYFVVYYLMFRFFIIKWNLKTPGREADGEETKMMSMAEYQKATGIGFAGGKAALDIYYDMRSVNILIGVGGSENISEIDCCATRLRLTLVDGSKVREDVLRASGTSGIVLRGNAIQIVYGPSVTIVKSNFEELVEKIRIGKINEADLEAAYTPQNTEPQAEGQRTEKTEAVTEPYSESVDISSSETKSNAIILSAHMNGTVVPIDEVADETFASRIIGDGVAIEPSEGKLFAPADSVVTSVFETKHAIGLCANNETEILLHIGIDTVKLGGKFFEVHIEQGQNVKKGDLLVSFDMEGIKNAGFKLTTPMIVCNTENYKSVKAVKTGEIKAGEDLLSIQA